MKAQPAVKVFVSRRAYYQIRKSMANAGNAFEVGGVLLGHRFLKRHSIVAVTVPASSSEGSMVSFSLDGEWHAKCALEMLQGFRFKPRILGLWHSHICSDGVFSDQDRLSNKQFAKQFNGALSMLVVMKTPTKSLDLTTYLVSPDGTETRCQVICQDIV